MHLHLHIRECVENYVSVYGFWLFSFERYNGLLGSFHTNNREIEVQLMSRFLTMSALDDMQYSMPSYFQDSFEPLCNAARHTNQLSEGLVEPSQSLSWTKAMSGPLVPNCSVWTDLSMIQLPSRYRLCSFDIDEIAQLRSTYSKLYPATDLSSGYLNLTYKKYPSLCVGEERLSSGMESRLYKHARVMASWLVMKEKSPCVKANQDMLNFILSIHLKWMGNSTGIVLHVCSGLKNTLMKRHFEIRCLFFMLTFLSFPVLQHLFLFKEYSLAL